jgi:hypothetical protein
LSKYAQNKGGTRSCFTLNIGRDNRTNVNLFAFHVNQLAKNLNRPTPQNVVKPLKAPDSSHRPHSKANRFSGKVSGLPLPTWYSKNREKKNIAVGPHGRPTPPYSILSLGGAKRRGNLLFPQGSTASSSVSNILTSNSFISKILPR